MNVDHKFDYREQLWIRNTISQHGSEEDYSKSMADLASLAELLKVGDDKSVAPDKQPNMIQVLKRALVLSMHRADWKALHTVWIPTLELAIETS